MNSDPDIVVCISNKKYMKSLLESKCSNKEEFNLSIGLTDRSSYYSYISKPYIIKGGIPTSAYVELIVVDQKLFEYSKLKYELYND